MSNVPRSFAAFTQSDSDVEADSSFGARRVEDSETSPLRQRVNLAVINLTSRIGVYEAQVKHPIRSINGQQDSSVTNYIHLQGLVDAILDLCSNIFSGVINPQVSYQLVTALLAHVNPEYHNYIHKIVLMYAMHHRDHEQLQAARVAALHLLEPGVVSGRENIPIFKSVPASRPNAPLQPTSTKTQRAASRPVVGHSINAQEAGGAGAYEFIESLRKDRGQIEMARAFSELFRIRLELHSTFTQANNNDALIELCKGILFLINTDNESTVQIGADTYRITHLLTGLVEKVQQELEAGKTPQAIVLRWEHNAGAVGLLAHARNFSHDASTRIFFIDTKVTDPPQSVAPVSEAAFENNAFNLTTQHLNDDIEDGDDDDVLTSAKNPLLPATRIAVRRRLVAVATPIDLDESDIPDIELFTPYGVGSSGATSNPDITPVEDQTIIRNRIILDLYQTTKTTLAEMIPVIDESYETAKLLAYQSVQNMPRTEFVNESGRIFAATAELVIDSERISNELDAALTRGNSTDALHEIERLHFECEELAHRLQGIRENFTAYGQRVAAYLDSPAYKARKWMREYFEKGYEVTKRGLTYEGAPAKETTPKGIRKKTRNATLKIVALTLLGTAGMLAGKYLAERGTTTDESPTAGITSEPVPPTTPSEPPAATAPPTSPTQGKNAKAPKTVPPQAASYSYSLTHATLDALSTGEISLGVEGEESHADLFDNTVRFDHESYGKIVKSQVEKVPESSQATIVTLKKGEGLSQSALRLHKELVTQKVAELLSSQNVVVDGSKLSQAVAKHIKTMKGAESFGLAMTYIGSSELNDPLTSQLDTTKVQSTTVINPQGNVNLQALHNSYAVELNNASVQDEVNASAAAVAKSFMGKQNIFNKAAVKFGGMVKGFFKNVI